MKHLCGGKGTFGTSNFEVNFSFCFYFLAYFLLNKKIREKFRAKKYLAPVRLTVVRRLLFA